MSLSILRSKVSHTKLWSVMLTGIFLLPGIVNAHAIPVSMFPQSSSVQDVAPTEVSIRFSERVDEHASAITIAGPKETVRTTLRQDSSDERILSSTFKDQGRGTYVVTWSVVSADDGHFTKGAYAFALGAGEIVATTTERTEVVAIATTPEALAMTIELMGNGLIWAVLFLTAYVIRPLKRAGRLKGEESYLYEWTLLLMGFALVLVLTGAYFQLFIKTNQLSDLQGVGLFEAFKMYISTSAGSATMYRALSVLAVFVLYVLRRKQIFASGKFTVSEGLLMIGMATFAYLRAIVSHATANPFFPPLSIGFNFLHVIEKDVWAGLALMLALLALQHKRGGLLAILIPRVFTILSINFMLVSVTAAYIIWLHLKSFDNLFSTQWGTVCLQLLAAASALVAIRSYHVFARLWRPTIFSRFLSFSLGAEFGAALLVLYLSSVVIITSPPLSQPPFMEFRAYDQGALIRLENNRYEDGMLLLTSTADGLPEVSVEAMDTSGTILVDLEKRFDGGYVLPKDLLFGRGPFTVSINVPQTDGYDARAVFEVPGGAFEVAKDWERFRVLDGFTYAMIFIALSALMYGAIMYRCTTASTREGHSASRYAASYGLIGFAGIVLVFSIFVAWIGSIANPFKLRCESDGNMWHMMQPMKAGVPLAEVSTEGCMWGMGTYRYFFPDAREYDFYAGLPQAHVSLDRTTFAAGMPEEFAVSILEPDGTPAKLFVDMTKPLHVVIVSRDQTVFAHIHPDDFHAPTKDEVNSSRFKFKFVFPKAGEYLVSVDYAHGLKLESKQFIVKVEGQPEQSSALRTYPKTGTFDGYQVSLKHADLYAGEVSTIQYDIRKDSAPVKNAVPYLDAAMHISAVHNDLTHFVHVHGEVHPPGQPAPRIVVRNGQIVHSMDMMSIPDTFGPTIEAHLIFPAAGTYTIWGEFKVADMVVPTSFTVDVR